MTGKKLYKCLDTFLPPEVNVKGLETSVEKIHIQKFLAKIEQFGKCPGLSDRQDYKLKASQGYRFVSSCMVNGKPMTTSTIRALSCWGGIAGCLVCAACAKLSSVLEKVKLKYFWVISSEGC
jgi:hypothetical protein